MGRQTSAGWGKMRQYHSPDVATAAAFYDSLIYRVISHVSIRKKV